MTELYRFRKYNVTGAVIRENDHAANAGQRVRDDFTIGLVHIQEESTQHLKVELGYSDIHGLSYRPYVTVTPDDVTAFLNAVNKNRAWTEKVDGHIYQISSPATKIVETDIPVTLKPVTISAKKPPGLVLEIGNNPMEGAQIEFTPNQSKELFKVFQAFLDGSLADRDTGLNPLGVDETGTVYELK